MLQVGKSQDRYPGTVGNGLLGLSGVRVFMCVCVCVGGLFIKRG